MTSLDDAEKLLYSLSDPISIRQFMVFGEFSLIFIFMTSLLFKEFFIDYILSATLMYLNIILIFSFILLFTKHRFTFIAFLSVIFIIAGTSILSFFLELSTVSLQIHPLEILFMINAVVIVFIGWKLLQLQYTKIQKNSILFSSWSLSILFIAYIPVAGLDLSQQSLGYGMVTSVIFGGILSVVSLLLYLKSTHDEEMVKKDKKRSFKDLEPMDERFIEVDKLPRDRGR